MIHGKLNSSDLKFQAADVFDVRCPARPVERHDDGQTHRNFGGRNCDDEKNENLRVVVRQPGRTDAEPGKCDERRFAAFNISSSDMKMMMMLRRSITPANPIVKRARLRGDNRRA